MSATCAPTHSVWWRPLASVVLAAAAYSLACPPYGWALAAWIVPGALLVGIAPSAPWRAFLWGLIFALLIGVGITGWALPAALAYFDFHWLSAALFVAAVWLIYAGIPFACLAATYAWASPRVPAVARGPLAAWLWVGAELLRAHLFTGMPWELLGHTQFDQLLLIQIADLGGVYAVSFVIALLSVSAADLAVNWRIEPRGWQTVCRRLALPLAALAVVLAYGVSSRARHDVAPSDRATRIAVVQADIPNHYRWKRAFFERTLATYAELTPTADAATADLIVWPENAVSFYVNREAMLRAGLGVVAERATTGLLLGAPRLDDDGRAHNSAYLVGKGGHVLGTYDKRRLVPFAEYDPWPWSSQAPSAQPEAFTPGQTATTIDAGAIRLGAIICYEILFPQLVRDVVRHGADVLVNLSNDSWMDDGSGAAPEQHLSMSVFRAIEARRYLVRASASGVSAFVNPYGVLQAVLPRHTAGAAIVPVERLTGITPYVRWGDGWTLAGVLVVLVSLTRSTVPARA